MELKFRINKDIANGGRIVRADTDSRFTGVVQIRDALTMTGHISGRESPWGGTVFLDVEPADGNTSGYLAANFNIKAAIEYAAQQRAKIEQARQRDAQRRQDLAAHTMEKQRLSDAAPAMLAALERATAAIEGYRPLNQEEVKAIRAAIAQAKGQA